MKCFHFFATTWIHASTWLDLESIMPTKKSQSQRIACCMILFIGVDTYSDLQSSYKDNFKLKTEIQQSLPIGVRDKVFQL